MKKILITGGAGFIGANLILYLIKNKYASVINVDKLTYAGNLESLKSVENNPHYQFEKADICNKDQLVQIFQKYRPKLTEISVFW